ncbi:MAG TPA: tetratricopeptide repeat protein [Stellaceae bacterium]
MLKRLAAACAAVVLLGGAVPIEEHGGSGNNMRAAFLQCGNFQVLPMARAGVCTAVIKSRVLPPQVLAMAYVWRGIAFVELTRFDAATADYDAAVGVVPDFAPAYMARADLHLGLREHDQAVAALGEVIRRKPDDIQALVKRGSLLDYAGRQDEAIADFNEAIRLDPERVGPFVDRGLAYQNKGDFDRAAADFDEAIRLDPNDSGAYRARGRLRFRQDAFAAAADDFTAAADLAPADPYAALWRFLAQARTGQSDEAAAELERRAGRLNTAVWPGPIVSLFLGRLAPDALDPGEHVLPLEQLGADCELHFYRGEHHLLHGESERAAAEFRLAVATGITEYVEYGAAQRELGRLGR